MISGEVILFYAVYKIFPKKKSYMYWLKIPSTKCNVFDDIFVVFGDILFKQASLYQYAQTVHL